MREAISVFDIFKLGVGPSSSHTLGPWRAAQRFLRRLEVQDILGRVASLRVDLFGSLAKTGKGHGTDRAAMLGLLDTDPVTLDTAEIPGILEAVRARRRLVLAGRRDIPFDPDADIVFNRNITLPFHPNGMRFTAFLEQAEPLRTEAAGITPGAAQAAGIPTFTETYFSIGGGFIVRAGEAPGGEAPGGEAPGGEAPDGEAPAHVRLPMPIDNAADLLRHCREGGLSIPQVVRANEAAWRSRSEVDSGLERIWLAMRDSVYRGCHTEGVLPGGLKVARRAAGINRKLLEGTAPYDGPEAWMDRIRGRSWPFDDVLKWVSAFALAVNEENAAFGRVVTAPTNGAAGVIPAVLMYYECFCRPPQGGTPSSGGTPPGGGPLSPAGAPPGGHGPVGRADFLLTAGEFGSLFKKGATLSAAMGGCQAEIGVSSAMAAAGLTQCLGGSAEKAMMAAEIAMEHHLGLTCDPVGGLVQVPCIERNTMGAVKAITASNLALEGDPAEAKVSLDAVIQSMWATAKDMDTKYQETSEGGLAAQIPVNVPEC